MRIIVQLVNITIFSFFLCACAEVNVVDYQSLLDKAKNGQVSIVELRIGAFDLVENKLCQQYNIDELKESCVAEFNLVKDMCAISLFDSTELGHLNVAVVEELLRQFALCSRNPKG